MGQTNTDKKALKSGVWYIACNFLVKGAVFLSTPIFTRLMSVDDIGAFGNISAWVHILTIVTSLELFSSVTFARFEYEGKLDEYISSILGLSGIVTACFYLVALLFRKSVMQFIGTDLLGLNLIFLYCVFYPALQMIQVKNRVTFEYKISTVLSVSSVLLSIISAVLLVIFLQNKLTGRMIGYYGSLILFNLVVYGYLLNKGKRIDTRYWRFALTISIPMIIHGLSGQLLSVCDRIMIKQICGNSMAGLYTIAYTGATVINILWVSLNTAWSPWAYEQMNNKTYDRLKKVSKPYAVLFLFVVFAFLVFAPEFLLIMGGKRYLEAIVVIPPVVIGMFFQFVYSLYVNIEFFHKKQKYTAVGTSIAAFLNIVLNWLLIPVFGYVAAAYTTLIGYIALFVIHFFIVYKMKKTWWYDTKFNVSILLLSLLMIPCFLFLYQHNTLRYGTIVLILAVMAVLLYRYRKPIIRAVKNRSLKPVLEIFNQ